MSLSNIQSFQVFKIQLVYAHIGLADQEAQHSCFLKLAEGVKTNHGRLELERNNSMILFANIWVV